MFKILTVTVVMTDRLKRKEENEAKMGKYRSCKRFTKRKLNKKTKNKNKAKKEIKKKQRQKITCSCREREK